MTDDINKPDNPGTSLSESLFGQNEKDNFRRALEKREAQLQQQLALAEAKSRSSRNVAPNRANAYKQATSTTKVTNNTNENTEVVNHNSRVEATDQIDANANPSAEAAEAYDTVAGQEAFSSIPALPGGGNTGYFATGDNCARPASGGYGQSVGPQGGGGAFPGAPKNVVPPADLENDPAWQAELAKLKEEFPELDEQELYRIIQGESGFNSTAVNADTGAAGFFQFIPSTAAGLGTTTGAIQNMTPAQQLEVYGRYLRQSNYQGGPLGMIQAAPESIGI